MNDALRNSRERALASLCIRLIGPETACPLPEGSPRRKMADLTLVPRLLIEDSHERCISSTVSPAMLRLWGMTEDDVIETAIRNSERLHPPVLLSMEDMEAVFSSGRPLIDAVAGMPPFETRIAQLAATGFSEGFYIFSDCLLHLGAAVISYPGLLQRIADAAGCDLYLLPSSVHEVILIPASQPIDAESFPEIIRSANRSFVAPEDCLSDHAYRFDRAQGLLLSVPAPASGAGCVRVRRR